MHHISFAYIFICMYVYMKVPDVAYSSHFGWLVDLLHGICNRMTATGRIFPICPNWIM